MNIGVIMTCYNRKNKTLKCLTELVKQFAQSDFNYDIHLTDDGCDDGTAEEVKSRFSNSIIYKGGNLFWAGGMRLAWKAAHEYKSYDYYLLLNDDTYVNNNLVADLWECIMITNKKAIIVCNVCDPVTGDRTYAGDKIRKFPFKVFSLLPNGKPQYISYSGANCMFVPRDIVEKVGFFPDIYIHGIADLDYCLRAQRYGFKVIMTSRYCGTCESDHGVPTTKDLRKMSIAQRYTYLMSPKGKAAKQWVYYQWTFFPWRLPLVLGKILLQLLFGFKD
ncbi:glycosyltransferase family 2 protein [Bacteroides clarus]|jgi:GT2 family glycosyltransferase|uniref:glycosyltransferase family 2 protein n=1 Tax=Bacteroides clarus TaxID=626929 RepID=UPI0018AAB4E5|nr:glycosyltransferase family 2 protein [Bacteroides clarus]